MQTRSNNNTIIAIARGIKHQDENIRIGAIRGAEGLNSVERFDLLSTLLSDEVLGVRTEAARVLVPLWQQLSEEQRKLLRPALDEYMMIQEFNADRGFAHTNKANIYRAMGEYDKAIQSYNTSIRIESYFVNAYINLADLYRSTDNSKASIDVLRQGIGAIPNSGILYHSLGLAYVRGKNMPKATSHLQTATQLDPENAQFHFVHGLSIESADPSNATRALRTAYQLSNNPQHLYALCEMQVRHRAFQAKQCLTKLATVAPKNVIEQLKAQLKN